MDVNAFEFSEDCVELIREEPVSAGSQIREHGG
jgi:hypothetical protein